MRIRRSFYQSFRQSWWVVGWALLLMPVMLSCQNAETQATSPGDSASASPPSVASTPAQPPPRPETSLGRLVKVDTAPMVRVRVQYLTLNGLKSGTDDRQAADGNTFVVLHFEGKPPAKKKEQSGLVTMTSGADGRLEAADRSDVGEPKLWLTDAAGASYSDWLSFGEKDSGTIAFEVPEGTNGLVFHDGDDHAYPIEPPVATAARPEAAEGAK